MVLARRVAQSGVRLLLVRGSADPAFRACCAEQAVLCLTGTTSQDLPSSAGATVTRNQLIGLPRAQTVQLQGRLVVCGARRGSTRRRACHLAACGMGSSLHPAPSPADSIEDTAVQLHLQKKINALRC